MVPTPQLSKVVLHRAFDTVTGIYLGTAPGQPNSNSRRGRAEKYVIQVSKSVIEHVPKEDVLKMEVLP